MLARTGRIVVLGGACGLVALRLCLAAERSPSGELPAALAQRVKSLEEKVAQLEKKLEEQIARSYPVPPQPPSGVLPRVAPPAAPQAPGPAAPQAAPLVVPPVPPVEVPNGEPFQFNGHTYYIMPLGKDAAR